MGEALVPRHLQQKQELLLLCRRERAGDSVRSKVEVEVTKNVHEGMRAYRLPAPKLGAVLPRLGSLSAETPHLLASRCV